MDTLPPAAALAALDHLPHVMTPNAQQFLKMEDLHSPPASSSSPPPSAYDHRTRSDSILNTSPAPVIVHSKPAKKRKSWGQELPEPKTTLPPRKRAKTEDEKEQRRIERIKRNRAAAHNSRERKRQETETLAVALARANAELEAYRRLHGPLPASVVLPEVTLSTDSADTPAPSLVESHGSIATSTSPQSLADCLFDIDTTIKQEPSDNTLSMDLTPAFNLNPKSQLAALDSTQHSAAMFFQPVNYLVEPSLSLSPEPPAPDMLQDNVHGSLDGFAFTDGAYDASFNSALDFSFDDFIHDSAPVTADGIGAA
ncbi:Hypothetical protein R9X50_00162000 [Acrodontium crateriforme]|uniref:BZIP domain-containing protein n=1 Tax=Acrodontium crateriforme TaxID=150365 RepID=A0AAQ3M2C7_9PEZI|nr:Hypothetical protein R9X50_00162000 [Acrodontium crateriforme]